MTESGAVTSLLLSVSAVVGSAEFSMLCALRCFFESLNQLSYIFLTPHRKELVVFKKAVTPPNVEIKRQLTSFFLGFYQHIRSSSAGLRIYRVIQLLKEKVIAEALSLDA